MNYTKGEWTVTGLQAPYLIESFDTKNKRHSTWVVNDVLIKANAHLIAAAPDMYEALKELVYIIQTEQDQCARNMMELAYIQRFCEPALRKAEGI